MALSTFYDRFAQARQAHRSLLCVGLDPDPQLMPAAVSRDRAGMGDFLTRVVAGTAAVAVAYKPNLAFFEALPFGEGLLGDTVERIRTLAPAAQIIGDAKRGDISNTTRGYARAAFERFGFDAVTANAYMGMESLEPFLEYRDRATIVLCLTSNPGANQFQLQGAPPLFEQVARAVAERNTVTRNLWLVVGATRSADGIRRVRELAPSVPLLVPGIGAQGGDLGSVLGLCGGECLVNVGRTVMYATTDLSDTERRAAAAAEAIVAEMRRILGVNFP